MNRGANTLRMVVSGNDAFPEVQMIAPCGVVVTGGSDGELPVPGGCLGGIELEGARLRHVPEAVRRRLLRRARRLLAPGGSLTVGVGPQPEQYPRDDLERAAWSCGFKAFVRYVAGGAVLSVPRRAAPKEPLVSVLIPAYKPRHFAAALASALAQGWPRLEIIVADDSGGEAIARAVTAARPQLRPGQELRLIRNPGTLGGRANYLQLFAEARGQYVKYLNDDDLLAPDCVARMARVLTDHPQVTLVTSYRRLIDDEGGALPDQAFNRPVLAADGIIDGRALATLTLSRQINVVGEPTTTMFRKADAQDNRPHLMSYAGRSARRNGDMSIWTMLMSRGDVAWISEPLSSFRQHADQVQHGETFLREARLAWVELVADARDTGLISPAGPDLVPMPLASGQDATALTDRAEADHAAGDPDAAAAHLALALAIDPGCSRARTDLACLAWEAGRHDEAVLGALLALACPEPAAAATLNLRDMLEALGRSEQARAVAAFVAGGTRTAAQR